MADTILRMTGIQKYFPGVHALDNAQLEVREGEVMALVGENGAGKSTLMKVLTGIYPSDGGTIEFGGDVNLLKGAIVTADAVTAVSPWAKYAYLSSCA